MQPSNDLSGFKHLLEAAGRGHKEAMQMVESCYRKGIGTKKNKDEADKWLQEIKEH